jgi:hypothetical protein
MTRRLVRSFLKLVSLLSLGGSVYAAARGRFDVATYQALLAILMEIQS